MNKSAKNRKNIFSLKTAENKNIQPGPEKQHSYVGKSVSFDFIKF